MSAAVAATSSRAGPSAAPLPPQRNLSDSELADLYSNCVRLASENRINTKNVWLLPLIDYLDVVMRKQCSGETANFQLAGTTLEASMKIYSSRVDAVHGLGYHMLGGLSAGRADRANDEDNARGVDNDGSEGGSDAENDDESGAADGADARAGGAAGAAARGRTRKSRAGQKTLEQNPDALLVRNLESHYAVDPLFRRMAAQFDEGGARGLMLNQLGTAPGCRLLVDAMDSADATNAAAATNNNAAATAAAAAAGQQNATPARTAAHAAVADDAALASTSTSAASETAAGEQQTAAGVPTVAITSASTSPSHHTQAAAVQQVVSAFDADGNGQRPFDDFDAGGPGFSDDDDDVDHDVARRGAGTQVAAVDGDEGSNDAGVDIARALRVNETVRGARASVAFADGVARSPGVGGTLHTPMGAMPGSATRSASAPHTPGGGPLTPGVPVARVGNLLLALDTTNEYSWLRTDKLRGWAGVSHWKFRASAPARRADGDAGSVAAAAADGARAAGEDGAGSAVAAPAPAAAGKRAGAGKRGKDAAAFTIDFLADTPENLFRRGGRTKKTIAVGAPAEPLTFPEDVHFEASSLRRPFLRPACALRSAAPRSASRRAGAATTPRAAGAGVTFADTAASGAAELVLHDARVFAGDAASAAGAGAPDHERADDASDHDDGDFGGPGLELDHDNDADSAVGSASQSQGATQPSTGIASQASVAAGGLELVAQPRAVARIDVKYAERATNVDVHKLKEGLWTEMRALTKGYKEETSFNHLLGCAPRAMPQAESADVTLPYVFICMLHLANEHGLQLDSSAAMDNISIKPRAPRT